MNNSNTPITGGGSFEDNIFHMERHLEELRKEGESHHEWMCVGLNGLEACYDFKVAMQCNDTAFNMMQDLLDKNAHLKARIRDCEMRNQTLLLKLEKAQRLIAAKPVKETTLYSLKGHNGYS